MSDSVPRDEDSRVPNPEAMPRLIPTNYRHEAEGCTHVRCPGQCETQQHLEPYAAACRVVTREAAFIVCRCGRSWREVAA